MGSSVNFCVDLGLWKTFGRKTGIIITTPRKFVFFGDNLLMNLRCHLRCQLLQMVLMEIKTAGYQA